MRVLGKLIGIVLERVVGKRRSAVGYNSSMTVEEVDHGTVVE